MLIWLVKGWPMKRRSHIARWTAERLKRIETLWSTKSRLPKFRLIELAGKEAANIYTGKSSGDGSFKLASSTRTRKRIVQQMNSGLVTGSSVIRPLDKIITVFWLEHFSYDFSLILCLHFLRSKSIAFQTEIFRGRLSNGNSGQKFANITIVIS